MARALVVGLGAAGRAVTESLRRRGTDVVVVEDGATSATRELAAALAVELVEAPPVDRLDALVRGVDIVCPSPAVPFRHPVFALAAEAKVPLVSELDLGAEWTTAPMLAITGTDGKTTVTTLVTEMLVASGVRAVACGNTDLPLVTAIDEVGAEVYVVEASSFRLQIAERFRPRVAAWLNFAPDHLDWHPSIEHYAAAKERIWAAQRDDDVAVVNADDPVVAAAGERAPARVVRFSAERGDYRLDGRTLVTPSGTPLVACEEMFRSLPHDIANALAASATALEGGATVDGVVAALRSFAGLPHRVALVGESGGVRFYDDSKATAPQAARAAMRGFPSVVLIAGGRNKGLDLSPLADEVDRVRAVVAIGESAREVEQAFAGRRPVTRAGSMRDAVDAAAAAAQPGDVVLLSPACASFDWYRSYGERGDDFARAVRELIGERAP